MVSADIDVERVRAAWARATDHDLKWALNHPEDYPSDVLPVIEAEAASRSIVRTPEMASPPRHRIRLGLLYGAVRKFANRHLVLSTCILCVITYLLLRLVTSLIGPKTEFVQLLIFVSWFLICSCQFAWLAAPLREFRRALTVCSAGSCVFVVCGVASLAWNWTSYFGPYDLGFGQMLFIALSGIGFGLLFTGVLPLVALSIIIFVRNRYWPVFAEGCCAGCGYDLRGSRERCPECGRNFLRAEVSSANQ